MRVHIQIGEHCEINIDASLCSLYYNSYDKMPYQFYFPDIEASFDKGLQYKKIEMSKKIWEDMQVVLRDNHPAVYLILNGNRIELWDLELPILKKGKEGRELARINENKLALAVERKFGGGVLPYAREYFERMNCSIENVIGHVSRHFEMTSKEDIDNLNVYLYHFLKEKDEGVY